MPAPPVPRGLTTHLNSESGSRVTGLLGDGGGAVSAHQSVTEVNWNCSLFYPRMMGLNATIFPVLVDRETMFREARSFAQGHTADNPQSLDSGLEALVPEFTVRTRRRDRNTPRPVEGAVCRPRAPGMRKAYVGAESCILIAQIGKAAQRSTQMCPRSRPSRGSEG